MDGIQALEGLEELKGLEALGFTWPSPAYIFGAILFGMIGFAAYRYGKRSGLVAPRCIGVTLMLYPYLVAQTWVLYLVGCGLCVGLYLYRR